MKQLKISELKSRLSEHLRAAEAGEVIEVMDRARRIARIVPITSDSGGLEIIPAEVSFASVRGIRLGRLKQAPSSLDVLRDERGER